MLQLLTIFSLPNLLHFSFYQRYTSSFTISLFQLLHEHSSIPERKCQCERLVLQPAVSMVCSTVCVSLMLAPLAPYNDLGLFSSRESRLAKAFVPISRDVWEVRARMPWNITGF